MKQLIVMAVALLASIGVQAAQQQCELDIKNEVHLDGKRVEIYQQQTPKVLIDEENNLFINGDKIDLDQMQQDAINSYRQNMNKYLPKVKEIARDGLALAQGVLDDVATSFDNSEAFNNVKQALEEFFNSLESRYQKEDEFVLQKAAVSDAFSNWKQDFADAKETLNAEFFSSAFTVLSEKMSGEGGINLTELKDKLIELQSSLEGKLQSESSLLKKDAEQYCDDLQKMAQEEAKLHQSIPQLNGYKVFQI